MKLKNIIAAALVAVSFESFASTSGQAAPAYTFTTAPSAFVDNGGSVSLGFNFTANTDVTVTSLGYHDLGGDGFIRPHELGIFFGGTQIAGTTLAIGTSGTLGPNNFRYQAIAPLVLLAGQEYIIAGFSPNPPMDPYLFGGPGTTGFSVNPLITIPPDAALFTYGSSLVAPSSHFGGFDFYGVNFEIAAPEPSTWALLLIGLAGLAFVAYRRGQKSIRVQPFGSNGVVA